MKLTIDKFQRLNAIASLEEDELEKAAKMVQILLDKSSEEIDKMPLKKFAKLCDKLQKAFDLKVQVETMKAPKNLIEANGNVYSLNFEIKKPFNTGRYIEVLTFSKSDPINDMHNILASICTPMKWSWWKMTYVPMPFDVDKHEQYADDMRQADFRHGYNAMVFFCILLADLTNNTEAYSDLLMKMMRQNKKRLKMLRVYSQKISDGYTQQSK
jgi:hypothetical protein